MRLIGTTPPPKWPANVFWLIVAIHLPVILLIILTGVVEGTIYRMISFWMLDVPTYLATLLFDPLRMLSAIIAVIIAWYLCRLDWSPLFAALFGQGIGGTFIRGRRLLNPDELRSQLASSRSNVRDRLERPRPLGLPDSPRDPSQRSI